MKIIEYPDGSSYAQAAATDTEFTFRLNSYDDLWKLHQAVDACNCNSIGIRPTVTIPNLIDAQADRRFNENETAGLKLVGQFLNNMNANFKIFHPHNVEGFPLVESVHRPMYQNTFRMAILLRTKTIKQ